MVVNPAEAETIKKISRLFLEGMTTYGISRQLESDGDLSPSRKPKWNATTVKRILSNEKYKGDALLQKTYTVDYLTKKTKVWHRTDQYRKVIWRCNHKYGGEKCSTPHLTEDEIKVAFITAANKALADKDTVIETFRLIKDSVFDTSALEQEKAELTDELNIVAGLIQDGIYQNAHVAQNQTDYNREYESLTSRYEKAKSRLDEVEAEIHDKHSRRKSIEHYLEILQESKEAVTEYDATLWHGMVEFVTVYSKNDIRFTMKDGTEIRA